MKLSELITLAQGAGLLPSNAAEIDTMAAQQLSADLKMSGRRMKSSEISAAYLLLQLKGTGLYDVLKNRGGFDGDDAAQIRRELSSIVKSGPGVQLAFAERLLRPFQLKDPSQKLDAEDLSLLQNSLTLLQKLRTSSQTLNEEQRSALHRALENLPLIISHPKEVSLQRYEETRDDLITLGKTLSQTYQLMHGAYFNSKEGSILSRATATLTKGREVPKTRRERDEANKSDSAKAVATKHSPTDLAFVLGAIETTVDADWISALDYLKRYTVTVIATPAPFTVHPHRANIHWSHFKNERTAAFRRYAPHRQAEHFQAPSTALLRST